MAVMNYVRKRGFPDISFYDIDCLRPSYEETLAHLIAEKPEVLGISAVVSTAYAYVKRLTLDVKKHLPGTLVVLGGNLAASAELLLQRTGVDVCVSGEGEKTLLNLLRHWQANPGNMDFRAIPGLVFLYPDDRLHSTGYADPLPGEELYDIDWSDLRKFSRFDHFFFPAFDETQGLMWPSGRYDSRSYEPERRNLFFGTIYIGKGCVARCTFCHRWDKGIRHIPVDVLMPRIEEMIKEHNVERVA